MVEVLVPDEDGLGPKCNEVVVVGGNVALGGGLGRAVGGPVVVEVGVEQDHPAVERGGEACYAKPGENHAVFANLPGLVDVRGPEECLPRVDGALGQARVGRASEEHEHAYR
jgi:hypothetical protein